MTYHWKKLFERLERRTTILSSYNYACNQGQRHVTLILCANLRMLFTFRKRITRHPVNLIKGLLFLISAILRVEEKTTSFYRYPRSFSERGKNDMYWYFLAKSNRYSSDPGIWSSFDLSCVFTLFAQKPQQRNHKRFHHCTVSPLHVKVFQSYEKCVLNADNMYVRLNFQLEIRINSIEN